MTGIQWTDETWNPVRGCTRVSEGCKHCYAEQRAYRILRQQEGLIDAGRLTGPPAYEGTVRYSDVAGEARWTGKIELVPHKLDEPLRWKRPRFVFVNSMSDLFHPGVPFDYVAAVFGVMAACPQHTFQVLTKRPERARTWFEHVARDAALTTPYDPPVPEAAMCMSNARRYCTHVGLRSGGDPSWPLPNVWIGTSVEGQPTADKRIVELLRCPAAVRFVSYEPALGPVTFTDRADRFEWLPSARCHEPNGCGWSGGLLEAHEVSNDPRDRELGITACPACGSYAIGESPGGLDWIIVGGESGPGARPFDVAWARSTIEQGRAAGVPVFVKQLGALPIDSDWVTGVYAPEDRRTPRQENGTMPNLLLLRDRKGGEPDEWPEDLRVREMPEAHGV